MFQDPYSSLNPRLTIAKTVSELSLETAPICQKPPHGARERSAERGWPAAGHGQPVSPRLSAASGSVALARALTTNPDCTCSTNPCQPWMCRSAPGDEPQRQIQERFGVSYLLIAHDLAVVKYVSTQIGVMYLGKLVETAASDELYARPLHPYTRCCSGAASSSTDVRAEVILSGEECRVHSTSRVPFPPAVSAGHADMRRGRAAALRIVPGHGVACHLYHQP